MSEQQPDRLGAPAPDERLVPDDVAPPGRSAAPESDEPPREQVAEPAKVMRVGAMIKQLLEEVRSTDLDEASRSRLRDIYRTSVEELGTAVSPDLRAELDRLAPLFDEDSLPSDAELRIAQAQLVGWLEGLFHGIQATLFAQQMAARQQLEHMRAELPQGDGQTAAPGTYL
jgi:Bacterial proteasome activator